MPKTEAINIWALLAEANRRSDERSVQSSGDVLNAKIAVLNADQGSMPGDDCPNCRKKGWVAVRDGDDYIVRDCQCLPARLSINRMRRSGLGDMLKRCTFDTYVAEEPWQKRLLSAAQDFVSDHAGKWFYIGGQVGCGKTHICTAIVGELLKQGLSARYIVWPKAAARLKAVIMDSEAYNRELNDLQTTGVLYIDDFFKTETGKAPSTADIRLAFELLNHRYISTSLVTVISSERTVDGITDTDEAVGSRVYERTRGFCLAVPRDTRKNYRLRETGI